MVPQPTDSSSSHNGGGAPKDEIFLVGWVKNKNKPCDCCVKKGGWWNCGLNHPTHAVYNKSTSTVTPPPSGPTTKSPPSASRNKGKKTATSTKNKKASSRIPKKKQTSTKAKVGTTKTSTAPTAESNDEMTNNSTTPTTAAEIIEKLKKYSNFTVYDKTD